MTRGDIFWLLAAVFFGFILHQFMLMVIEELGMPTGKNCMTVNECHEHTSKAIETQKKEWEDCNDGNRPDKLPTQ